MAAIKILSAEVASRVAAGEVVTRPLNVVKELVENAVDAGSKAVLIELLNGGKRRISVSDNGPGMSRDDLLLCVESHATSKLHSIDDFNTLKSFGFRGEALHSIAAVSRLQIESRQKNTDHGYRLEIYGGRQQEMQLSPIAKGTKVVVKDLFFNIPARLKFLKSDNYEKDLIIEVLQSFILVHPSVSFRLLHNDKELLFSSGNCDEKEILTTVFRKGAEHFISLPESTHSILGFSIRGFLSPPAVARAGQGDFRIFINSRIVRYPTLYKTVRHVYEDICSTKSFSGLLFIKIPPRLVDVNIHPQKTEIRLDNELVISEFIQTAVRKALLSSDLITVVKSEPTLDQDFKANMNPDKGLNAESEQSFDDDFNADADSKQSSDDDFNADSGQSFDDDFNAYTEPPSGFLLSEPPLLTKASIIRDSALSLKNVSAPVTQPALLSKQGQLSQAAPISQSDLVTQPNLDSQTNHQDSKTSGTSSQSSAVSPSVTTKGLERTALENYRVIGQFVNSFIVIEQKNRLLLVDQHVAQETILFTEIYRGLQNPASGFATQNLLKPLRLSISALHSAVLSEHEKMLSRVGFSFIKKESGYLLKGTPPMLGSGFDEAVFIDILERLSVLPCGNALEKRHKEMAAIMACKGSIKAGMKLNQMECEGLIKQLAVTENPFFCPHGRPVIISFELSDILLRFGRSHSVKIFGEI